MFDRPIPTLPLLALGLSGLLACSDYGLNPDEKIAGDTALECADWEPDGDYAVDVDDGCLVESAVGSFDPVVEWQWNSNPINAGYDDIMATPAVGDVDGDGVPDVVFATFSGGAYTSAGALVAISGDGSGTVWSTTSIGGYQPYSSSAVALGDLEGDGDIEVCVSGVTAAVICVEGEDGSFLWAAGSEMAAYGAPAIADLDGDGLAEVIHGRQIFGANGTLVGMGSGGAGYAAMSVPVDWDGDGKLEIVAGNSIYAMDGTAILTLSGSDGMPAIGDFDADGLPDVVLTGGGLVRLFDNSGTQIWSVAVPGGGTGGPPTVADFDGDGAPEVGVAGQAYYTVFDTDGTSLWTNGVSDYSSSVTGSSVFDFEGDGSAEVVYADEITLWIFAGADGSILMEQTGHASGTLYEYPLIADVDGDGATEIIVASNDYAYTGWNGITVIGDAHNSWGPAREVWNQFAYHITNVNSDLSIPAVQTQNWLTWNNFRAGGTEYGPSHWQIDLVPGDLDVCVQDCTGGYATFTVGVGNAGLLSSSSFNITLRAGGVFGTDVGGQSFSSLSSGEGRQSQTFTLSEAEWGTGPMVLIVDEDEWVDECDEDNNTASLGPWPCDE